jgi:hypothetical protein
MIASPSCESGGGPLQRLQPVRFLIALAGAALAGAVPVVAAADAAPPSRVVSNYETASGNTLERDCGFSRRLPGGRALSIWLFCDTPIVTPSGSVGFIPGSTAAVGPFTAGQVPTGLSELPTPPAPTEALPSSQAPQPFLPTPQGLVLPDGTTACGASGTGSYAATWVSGVTREPRTVNSSLLLISFTDVCVSGGGSTLTTERFGLAEYDLATNAVTSMTRVFASATPGQDLGAATPSVLLGSPVFSGGSLYLVSARCASAAFGGCTGGSVFLARAPAQPASWQQSSSYQFWDPAAPGGWTGDPASAQTIIAGAEPFAVAMDSYSSVGQGLALIEETTLGGDFRVWHASSPTGSWSQGTPGKVPCSGGSGLNLCRALIGHPELSTSSQLLLSFYDPGDAHVRVAATPW